MASVCSASGGITVRAVLSIGTSIGRPRLLAGRPRESFGGVPPAFYGREFSWRTRCSPSGPATQLQGHPMVYPNCRKSSTVVVSASACLCVLIAWRGLKVRRSHRRRVIWNWRAASRLSLAWRRRKRPVSKPAIARSYLGKETNEAFKKSEGASSGNVGADHRRQRLLPVC